MRKRILSALLSVCMLLTVCLTPALATEAAVPTDEVFFHEVAESAGSRAELPVGEDVIAEIPVFEDETATPMGAVDAVSGDVSGGPAQLDAAREWISGLVLRGYDLFTGLPSELPTTGEGEFLVLAQSGVEGDTAVYALYLNSASCAPKDGVVSGQGVVAAQLGRDENGELAGYLAGSDEKLTLEQLLISIKAVEGGFTFSNSGRYLAFGGAAMVSNTAATTVVNRRAGANGAYQLIGGNRTLTLYVTEFHTQNASWQTNFWGPQADQGQVGSYGSSYIYFLHPHVDDSRTVTAEEADGTPIAANTKGDFVIPSLGRVLVDGEVTFTVPAMVASVTVATGYAASLTMDENGAFGVMGCTITMQDGTTTSQIARSGDAGTVPGAVSFARTADNRLYFGGEGEIRDISSMNTEVAPWLDSVGDRLLKSVSIGSGITAVGDNAFKFTNVTALTLPEGLKRIGESAFEGTKVETVSFPASLTEIGANAFRGALGLRQVTLPTGLTTLGTGAFSSCTRLHDVTVAGDSLTSIPASAFQAISHHSRLSLVFQGAAPASAYSDFDSLLPFLHQDGAIVYTQTAPASALVRSGGSDAFFANLNGGELTGVTLQGGVLPALPAKNGKEFVGWQVDDTKATLPGGSDVTGQTAGAVFTAVWEGDGDFAVACTVTIDGVAYTVARGETMGERMPAAPVREGLRFAGWVDSAGEAFTADTIVMNNMEVTST